MTEHSRCQPGTAGSDRRFPRSFARLGRLPQREIAGVVLFIFVGGDARAVLHALKVFLRELSILRELCDAEIIRSIIRPIGQAFSTSRHTNSAHLRNIFRGPYQLRRLDVDHRRIFDECDLILRCELLYANSVARRVADDLVVHVGDIHDVADAVPALAKKTIEQIDRDERAGSCRL